LLEPGGPLNPNKKGEFSVSVLLAFADEFPEKRTFEVAVATLAGLKLEETNAILIADV
jgi:hypothetical protein